MEKLWFVCGEAGLTPQNSNQNVRFKYFSTLKSPICENLKKASE